MRYENEIAASPVLLFFSGLNLGSLEGERERDERRRRGVKPAYQRSRHYGPLEYAVRVC